MLSRRVWIVALLVTAAAPMVHAQDATRDTIVIGQSAGLTGQVAAEIKEMNDGAIAYFESVNKRGGVFGRRIVLKTLDDGFEAKRAAENTRTLIDKEQVFALFGYRGAPPVEASMQAFTAARVPLIAPTAGTQSLRIPFNRYLFHIKASIYDEADKVVEHLLTAGHKSLAVFYQDDSVGKDSLAGAEQGLRKREGKLVASATYPRNTNDVAKAVATIVAAKPAGVVICAPPKPAAEFIKAYRKSGGTAQVVALSNSSSAAFIKDLGELGVGIGIAQVMPYPNSGAAAAARELQRLAKDNPQLQVSYTSMFGYVAAKIIVEGLRRAGQQVTRDKFVQALESMRDFDVGGMTVTYTNSDHNGSKFVEVTVIGNAGRLVR